MKDHDKSCESKRTLYNESGGYGPPTTKALVPTNDIHVVDDVERDLNIQRWHNGLGHVNSQMIKTTMKER